MNTRNYITRGARQRGLDPAAVLAVASVEGGFGGAIGDQGTSFGPFQLHQGGALPHGRGSRWANSQAGVDYALNEIAKVARGLHGRQAISAIVSRFERPAAPGAEIQKASSRYGKVGGGVAGVPLAPRPPGLAAAPDKTLLMQQVIGELGHRQPDVMNLAGLIQQSKFHPPPSPVEVMGHPGPPPRPRVGTAINELFYDPIGGIKHGQQIGAIGHHKDHVHVALSTGQAQQAALAHAKQMGLHVGEERASDVHPVHVKGSYHYRSYGKQFGNLREAADVSGSPHAMAAFYRWVAQHYG